MYVCIIEYNKIYIIIIIIRNIRILFMKKFSIVL